MEEFSRQLGDNEGQAGRLLLILSCTLAMAVGDVTMLLVTG